MSEEEGRLALLIEFSESKPVKMAQSWTRALASARPGQCYGPLTLSGINISPSLNWQVHQSITTGHHPHQES